MRPFVLISQARSGSTMLGTTLGAHPQVAMHGEIFGDHHFPLNFYGIDESLPWPTPLEIKLKQIRDRDPFGFLDGFVFADTARLRVGFKFKFEEFTAWPHVVDYIRQRQIDIIYLQRKDKLRAFLSQLIADARGSFNSTDKLSFGPAGGGDLQTLASPERARAFIGQASAFDAAFRQAFGEGNRVLEVFYEDITATWDKVFASVCRFLGLDAVDLAPATRRRDQGAGYEPLYEMLRGQVG